MKVTPSFPLEILLPSPVSFCGPQATTSTMATPDFIIFLHRYLVTCVGAVLVSSLLPLASGCKPTDPPLKEENERLREQVAKQDSVIASLQEGNKYVQQEINLVTRELREAKKEIEQVEAERKILAAKLEAQSSENRKLALEIQRQTAKKAQAEQVLRVEEKGGQSEELPQSLAVVCKATEGALSRNGYALLVSVRMEQKAVYVTERKSSPASSLEVSGFRNQYLVSLHTVAATSTRVHVKADFEKVAQGGRLLAAGPEETADIERRLISEITKALAAPGKV